MAKATTVRFTDEVYQRLDQASARTGMPVNSIVIAACLEWMQRHTPTSGIEPAETSRLRLTPPRWSTIRRAIEQVAVRPTTKGMYPFERFGESAKKLLTLSQEEAHKAGFPYIGTEHLLLACFADADFQSAQILATLGVDVAEVRAAIDAVGAKRPRRGVGVVPTSRVKRVIEIAFATCTELGHARVGSGHLLFGLAAEGHSIAAQVLVDHGATTHRIDEELRKLTEPEP